MGGRETSALSYARAYSRVIQRRATATGVYTRANTELVYMYTKGCRISCEPHCILSLSLGEGEDRARVYARGELSFGIACRRRRRPVICPPRAERRADVELYTLYSKRASFDLSTLCIRHFLSLARPRAWLILCEPYRASTPSDNK